MAAWSRKQSYVAVTTTVCLWAVVAVLTTLARPLIPADRDPTMAAADGDFLRLAAESRIDWKLPTAETFQLARRQDRPILLVLGGAWNTDARHVDETLFRQSDIVEQINRDFLPVRVDLIDEPGWATVFRPLAQASRGTDPSFQIHFLSPTAQLVSTFDVRDVKALNREGEFVRKLREIRDVCHSRQRSADQAAQEAEATALTGGRIESTVEFPRYLDSIRQATDREFGGLVVASGRKTWPALAAVNLVSMGQIEDAQALIDPLLRSPMVNWIDGGCFRVAEDRLASQVRYETLAATNADVLICLATLWRQTGEEWYRQLAIRTWGGLFQASVNGIVPYSYSPEESNGRSERYSATQRRVRDVIEEADQVWLTRTFGLSNRENPRLVPRVPQPKLLMEDWGRGNRVLDRLRETAPTASLTFGEQRTMDTSARVIAAMITASSVLGEADLVDASLRLFDQLARLRIGTDEVIHAETTAGLPTRSLGDYTAYAEACAAYYAATGNENVWEDGRRVLARSLFLFRQGERGDIVDYRFDRLGSEATVPQLPQVTDIWTMGSYAQAVRLLHVYSVMSGNGRPWLGLSTRLASWQANVANSVTFGADGFVWAAWQVTNDRAVLTVGPESVALAGRLQLVNPSIPVLPVVSPLRPDVRSRGAGLYLQVGERVTGPVSFDVAEAWLRNPPG